MITFLILKFLLFLNFYLYPSEGPPALFADTSHGNTFHCPAVPKISLSFISTDFLGLLLGPIKKKRRRKRAEKQNT